VAEGKGYTIKHRDDFERSGRWALVRRSLGVESFGLNIVELAPGDGIPEHDEIERDQEEVFVVLSGDAAIVLNGEEHPAPAGTYARVEPELSRRVVNTGGRPASVLIVSAPRSSGYEPLDWA
jgi:uncharacterized cupin superfamily protein